jgi:glycosyltransferase involved in cell wall biosynthesis
VLRSGAAVPPSSAQRSAGSGAGPIPLLFLVTSLDQGGAQRVLARWASGLPRDKYAVQVAYLQRRPGVIEAELRRAGIAVHDLGMRNKADLAAVIRLMRLLQRERIRVLFAFMFHAAFLGRLAGSVCRVPVRISSERTMEAESRGRRLFNRWTVPLATHVVAVSERVASYAAREFRIPGDRLTTIVNGVDLDRFRPAARTRDPRAPVLGCTARLGAENDHATLIHAFARLGRQWPDAQLLLVGRGAEEAALRALADSLGVEGRVCFAGEQADVAPWLARMDVYVQAARLAGISNSILEAMATGLPVVATDVGGTSEAVVHGETGLLVPVGDPAALADALGALLANPARAEAFGHAGRARAEAHFGEKLILDRVEALLDRLVTQELRLAFEPPRGWVPC